MAVVAVLGVLLALGAAVGAGVAIPRVRGFDLRHSPVRSVRFLARDGRLLRSLPLDERLRARWLETGEQPPLLRELTVLAEDGRFRWHPGVDPLALGRALAQNAAAGRVVSGGSTLTTQIVRLLHPRPRTVGAKVDEAFDALVLDRLWSKDDQLTFYLNAAPYGHGLTGVAEAADGYFGKAPTDLTPLEAALLVVAPRAPSRWNPAVGGAALHQRALALLERAAARGVVPPDQVVLARSEAPTADTPAFPAAELHATERARAWLRGHPELGPATEVTTTLDARLQGALARVLRRHLARPDLRARGANGAVVVLDARTSDVLGYVGSADYFDPARKGANDGVATPRQPGSTLKPLLYAVALEHGKTLASPLLDVPTRVTTAGGTYAPVNFGRTFAGPVRLRLALANSLNVPAARTLSDLGVDVVLARLRALGLALPHDADHYGLGLALGNGEVPLQDLAAAYAALVNGGVARTPRLVTSVTREDGSRIALQADPGRPALNPVAAWLITDALADPQARAFEFGASAALDLPWRVAVKTGTSADFRDSLAVAATPEHVVAVWVGTFDRDPLPGTAGAVGAGPILHDALDVLYGDHEPRWPAPPLLALARVCALSGQLPGPDCPSVTTEVFAPGTEPREPCRMHVRPRLDLATGLLAGPACPDADVDHPSRLDLPPEARDWARQAGLPLVPDAWSPRCPGQDLTPRAPLPLKGEGDPAISCEHSPSPARERGRGGEVFRLVSPAAGAIFYLDPGLPPARQIIVAQADDPQRRKVIWTLDGRDLGTFDATEAVSVRLSEGLHTLTAAAGGDATSVTFEVRR